MSQYTLQTIFAIGTASASQKSTRWDGSGLEEGGWVLCFLQSWVKGGPEPGRTLVTQLEKQKQKQKQTNKQTKQNKTKQNKTKKQKKLKKKKKKKNGTCFRVGQFAALSSFRVGKIHLCRTWSVFRL